VVRNDCRGEVGQRSDPISLSSLRSFHCQGKGKRAWWVGRPWYQWIGCCWVFNLCVCSMCSDTYNGLGTI